MSLVALYFLLAQRQGCHPFGITEAPGPGYRKETNDFPGQKFKVILQRCGTDERGVVSACLEMEMGQKGMGEGLAFHNFFCMIDSVIR
jgi:hypothetical protein